MRIPNFVQSALKYTSANLLNAVIPILLLPLLTAYLSKEDYGLVSIFQVIVMITLPFVGFSASAAIERGYYEESLDFPNYVSNGLYTVLASGGLLLFIAVIFQNGLHVLTDFPGAYFWTIPVYCVCFNVSEIVLSYWRLKNKATSYGLFRIGRTCIEVTLSIILVVTFSQGWLGRLNAMVITVVLFSIVGAVALFRVGMLKARLRRDYITGLVRFGAPLIPHVLGGVVMVYSDRLFIAKMVGLAETGSYTVGYQVAMAISLLSSSFNLAWVPWFYGKLSQNDEGTKLKIVKFTYLYNLLILASAIGLTLAAPLIFSLFINESYHDSIQFVFWIALGFAFDGMYKMVVNYIFFMKMTYVISIVTFVTALLNLVLNYVLIKMYGPIGAAQATAFCMFLEFISIWMISSRMYKMPWLYFIPIVKQK